MQGVITPLHLAGARPHLEHCPVSVNSVQGRHQKIEVQRGSHHDQGVGGIWFVQPREQETLGDLITVLQYLEVVIEEMGDAQ